MTATLFLWQQDGLLYAAWIKDQALAHKLEKMTRTWWDVMYFKRRDYEIGDSNIKFDDDFYLSWLKELAICGE